ncbi:MAG: bacteriohopanetetrol glucosamine biosynthesis glycosyltransferase HpnI [Verrucomicrobiota bacterium]
MLLTLLLALLALLSIALNLWQWLVAWRFPLHRRERAAPFAPAITIFKPLKGADAETIGCLRSWFEQDYAGPVQILFGVASKDDPVREVVEGLLKQFPQADAQWLICPESLGPNAKVSTLTQLQRHARHELVLVSDADVWVPRDFLAQVVLPLRDPTIGLVNCFYQLANPSTAAMRWEAVAINADFWSQVLQSQSLKPLDFALGAVMVTRRHLLEKIGGFRALVDCLADDYQLGNRIARLGQRIVLSPLVVECRSHAMDWSEVGAHQLRWARTIRVCQPLPYFFSVLNNQTLWTFLLALRLMSFWGIALVLGSLAVRYLTARANAQKLTGKAPDFNVADVMIKDLCQAAVWLLAFAGNTVVWRGDRFRVLSGGQLKKLKTPDQAVIRD